MPEPGGRKKRKIRQNKRRLYQMIREDLQLSGDLPVVPEGALRPEQVDPATQTEAPQVAPVAQALRNGWAVPEHRKPDLVDELLAIVNSADPEMSAKTKVAAFNALRMADQQQWERDHPQQAKALGVSITNTNNVQNNVVVGEVFSDIEKLKASYELITGTGGAVGEEETGATKNGEQANSEAAGGVRANGDAQPVDEAEPYNPEEEPKAD